jgi:hypothetical protein
MNFYPRFREKLVTSIDVVTMLNPVMMEVTGFDSTYGQEVCLFAEGPHCF